MNPANFSDFFAALRAGDQDAATRFVRKYEPYLLHIIRKYLVGHPARRCFDSVDVCQSVLGKFFHRSVLGRLTLHSPGEAKNLLATMAIRKLINRMRDAHPGGALADGCEPVAPGPSPAEQIADRDLHRAISWAMSQELSRRERWLLSRRAEGASWVDLAREGGGTPDGLRVRHARAVARIREMFSDLM